MFLPCKFKVSPALITDCKSVRWGLFSHSLAGLETKSIIVLLKVGQGRCCVVYSGVSVFDGSPVALKFYKPGPDYEGALQRERFVMDRFSDPQHNLVTCLAYINYRGLHCLVMELLHLNIRQVRLHVTPRSPVDCRRYGNTDNMPE